MDDSTGVDGGKSFGNGSTDFRGFLMGEGSATKAAAECFALEQLGDGIGDAVVGADVEEDDDVGMGQGGDDASLALKAGESLGVGGEMSGQNFDGNFATEARIAGAVDLSHAASAQGGDDLIRSKFCTRSEGHDRGDYTPGISCHPEQTSRR